MKIDYDKWCNQCTNHKLNSSKGIICGLTNEEPNFTDQCNNFKIDEKKIRFIEYKEHINSKREQQRNESAIGGDRVILFNFLKEKNLLLPFYMILLILFIFTFDSESVVSILGMGFLLVYTIVLIFSSRYLSNNERYIFIDDDRVKDMIGPGLVTNLSIYKYHKIDINLIAPDLINEKYDYKIKNRINEQIRNGTLNFKI